MIPIYCDDIFPHITGRDNHARRERREGHRAGLLGTTMFCPPIPAMKYYKGGGGGIIKSIVIAAAIGAITAGIGFGMAMALEGTALAFGSAMLEAGLMATIAQGAIMGAAGGALSGALGMMAGKGGQEVEAYSRESRENKFNSVTSVGPRKKIYGTAYSGGHVDYRTSTGSTKEYLHEVVSHASHQCKALREAYFNNLPESNSRFTGFYRINKHLGTQTQTADSDLVSESTEWTTAHRGRGVAYHYSRIKYDTNAWVTGKPTTSIMVDGAIVYDPRNAGVAISTSSQASPGVFSTVGAHGFADGDIVFIRNHSGATYASTSGLSVSVTKKYTINTVPSSTTFTLLNDGGEPMSLLTAGSGGTVTKCAWSNNWALSILDFIVSSDGINCREDEVDWSYFEDAADVSDEDVSLGTSVTFTASELTNALTLASGVGWQTGMQVYVSSSGTLPAPLSANTAYYWVRNSETTGNIATSYDNAAEGTIVDLSDAGTGTHTIKLAWEVTLSASSDTVTLPNISSYIETGDCVTLTGNLSGTDYYWINTGYLEGKLATSRANAISGTSIDIGSDETAQITRKNQARYTLNGIIDLSKKPIDILNEMLTAGGGVMVYTQGKYRLFAAAPATSVKTLTESDLAGNIRVLPRTSRMSLINAIRGTYKEPAKYWEMTDFAPITSSTYEQEDGGVRLYKDMPMPHTIDAYRAQRIGSIALGRSRRGMVINFPATVKMLGISAWDCVEFDSDILGFSNKKFRVVSWSLNENGQGIDLTLNEEDDAIYTWSPSIGAVTPQVDLSSLPDPWNVNAPFNLQATEEIYVTRDGAGVKAKVNLSWENDDAGSYRYSVARYRLQGSGDTGWVYLNPSITSQSEILDIAPGIYDFQVQNYNTLGAYSPWDQSPTITKEIFGLAAPPAAMQNLTISAISSMALLRWTQSTDLDVRIGGKIIFRHSPITVAATWADSTSIGQALPGTDTVAVLPLLPGTYLSRFVDGSGVSGPVSSVTTDGATVLAFASVDSITESPTFPGTKTNVIVSGGQLMLGGSANIDDIPDFDAIASLDFVGGIVSSGTYEFASGIDLGTVQRVRLVKTLESVIENTLDLIDDRTSDIDTWESFDGDNTGNADAVVYVSYTLTDPLGSPVWSDWQRLDVAEFNARAFKFKCELSTDDTAYNIKVSTLTVTAEQI